ncbi:hypothetical protein OG558_24080 [Kribbella sp. NBC_01510]
MPSRFDDPGAEGSLPAQRPQDMNSSENQPSVQRQFFSPREGHRNARYRHQYTAKLGRCGQAADDRQGNDDDRHQEEGDLNWAEAEQYGVPLRPRESG